MALQIGANFVGFIGVEGMGVTIARNYWGHVDSETTAMNFGAQVRAGVRISEGDFRCRSRTFGATVETSFRLFFVL
jgi:hypothetical protein